LFFFSWLNNSHRIHGTAIFTYIYHIKSSIHVGYIYRSSHGSFGIVKATIQESGKPGGEGVTVAGTLGPWKAIEERRR